MQEHNNPKKIKHTGRVKQIGIYLGKFFRMFIYMDDWKVLPMAAVIAGLVSFVAGANIFKTMEGTTIGALALSCVCIWNGCFNSIQVVCRERDIVKREHRSGMHISSYVSAHVIYQAFLCLAQTIITIVVCSISGMAFPAQGLLFPDFEFEIGITLFLITFASDMMSLMISCIARNTTAAMTIMPFMLIFELLFSGSMFGSEGIIDKLSNLSIAKWGINCICSQGNYNSLPMVSVWNQIFKFKDVEIYGMKPINDFVNYMYENGSVEDFNLMIGQNAQNAKYLTSFGNIANCWGSLIMFAALFALIAVLVLERIDKDKR